jgi:hypothetical protein
MLQDAGEKAVKEVAGAANKRKPKRPRRNRNII